MRVYLMAQGYEFWNLVVTFSTTTNPTTDVVGRKLPYTNAKAMNDILSRLVCFELIKVI